MSRGGVVRALLVSVVLATGGCATAMSPQEMAWHSLNAADGLTTMNRCDGVVEVNPLLGSDPTDAEVAAYLVGFSVIYHYARKWVEDTNPDGLKMFDWITLGIKGSVVVNNAVVLNKEC